MDGSVPASGPLRIDVATSQIDGGQAVGWIDPDRVIGCVAFCEPPGAFERYVLPHIAEARPTGDVARSVPLGVDALVAGLKAAHVRLYRENHSLMKEPKWVRLTAACAEASRVYFVKTQTSWIYMLRAGKVYLVGEQGERAALQASAEALGGQEKLRLQVTSVEVTPDDLVLLVMGDADDPPDQHAIARLFAESQDLKRACDGLVNLLGLQGPSAAVVAFRFSSLLSGTQGGHLDPARGEQVLGEITEMARELMLGAQAPPAGAAPARTPATAPGLIEELAPPVKAKLGSQDETAAHARAANGLAPDRPTPDLGPSVPDVPTPDLGPSVPDVRAPVPAPVAGAAVPSILSPEPEPADPAREGSRVTGAVVGTGVMEATGADPSGAERPEAGAWEAMALREQAAARQRRGGTSALPIILLAVALFLLATILLSGAGWLDIMERARNLLHKTTGQSAIMAPPCLLDATTEPQGAIVSINGERIPGRTPLSGVRVPPGRALVAIHLGAVGAWSDSVDFEAGKSTEVHATFIGDLEVTAYDLTGNPRVWLEGQLTKRPIPASFENLAAGWYRVFFEDDRIPLWERKVLVRDGRTTAMEVNNAIAAGKVLIRVECLRMFPFEGLQPTEGDSVYVDGTLAGLTPLELELSPGLHGVKVLSNGEAHCEVLRLPAGASRFVTPRFGLRERPSFRHLSPGKVVLQGPIPLAVEIHMECGGLRQPELHMPEAAGGPRTIPLVKMDAGRDLYVGKAEVAEVELGHTVSYYFSVITADGDTVVSDLYRLIPVENASELALDPGNNGPRASIE